MLSPQHDESPGVLLWDLLESLTDEEARQNTGDGCHDNDQPIEWCCGQHVIEQVVDMTAPLQRQRAIDDEVQDPECCTAFQVSTAASSCLLASKIVHLCS